MCSRAVATTKIVMSGVTQHTVVSNEEQRTRLSRRGALAAIAGGLPAVTGCSGVLGRQGPSAVSVLCAGSLQHALLSDLDDAVGVPVEVEARGSAAAARLVADGVRDPGVVALADPVLFESVLDSPWYARIATNELAVAYDGTTDGGRRIQTADRWFDPVLAGDVTLGRTDPDLDPLGYRTLFALGLAADHYDRPALREEVLAESRIYPETSLLARLDTGAVGAAVVYRTMATDHGYDAVDLPAAIDLSDPDRAETYRTERYTLPDGTQVRGDAIEYAATVRHRGEGALSVFDALAGGDVLPEHGFRTPDRFPVFEGDVPDGVAG
jgi:molybdate/tungstate transport system substrate-binding protein